MKGFFVIAIAVVLGLAVGLLASSVEAGIAVDVAVGDSRSQVEVAIPATAVVVPSPAVLFAPPLRYRLPPCPRCLPPYRQDIHREAHREVTRERGHEHRPRR